MKNLREFGKGVVVGILTSWVATFVTLILISYLQWKMVSDEKVFTMDGVAGVWWNNNVKR